MEPGQRGASGAALGVAALVAAHLALVGYFAPRELLSGEAPLLHDQFAIEAYRAARVRLSLSELGAMGSYDPSVLAGQRAGLVELLGTRLFALGVPLLARLGVAPRAALGALVVALHALVPLVAYAAARAFRLERRASAVVVVAWTALWFFDSLVHAAWFTGRLPWVFASALLVVWLGLLRRGERSGPAALLGAAATGAVVAFVHPVAGIVGAAVGVGHSLRAPSALPRRRLGLLAASLGPLVALVGVRHAAALSSEGIQATFQATAWDLLTELLEIPGPGGAGPGPVRTLFRATCLVGAGVAWLSGRAAERRFAPLGLLVAGSTIVAYLGDSVPVPWPLSPRLLAVPAAFAAAIPAAALLAELPFRELARTGPAVVRIALPLALLLAVQRGYRTVASYVPELLPERVVRSPLDLQVSSLVGLGEPLPDPLRHELPPPGAFEVLRWLSANAAGRGRVLADEPELGALVALHTPLHVVAPLGERGGASRAADPTAILEGAPDHAEVERWLERYAVGWVVLTGPVGPLDREAPYLEPPLLVGGARVRRVVAEPRWFAEGDGELAEARLSVLRVRGAAGPRVTLRFHHDPAFECRPGCRVERVAVPGDAAGFLSVPSPPPEFELVAR